MRKIELKEVEETTLIKEHQKHKYPPTLNVLLDWRNRLTELRNNTGTSKVVSIFNLETKLYNKEIKAVDYLLQEHYS